MKYNKGEWSEAYIFLKILGDGKLYSGDSDIVKDNNNFYPVLKIIRDEIETEYNVVHEDDIDYISNNIIIKKKSDSKEKQINSSLFKESYKELYNEIIDKKGTTFEVPKINNLLNDIGILDIKSGSNNKSDLKMEIKDLELKKNQIGEYTIKSFIGSNPTILNASKKTNFKYRIKNIDDIGVKEVNKINRENNKNAWVKDRINYILENYDVTFDKVISETFDYNLKLIDSKLEDIISDLLLEFYSTKNMTRIEDLTSILVDKNNMNINWKKEEEKEIYYKSKIIDLIKAAAFGMMPSKKWDKKYDIDGGMILALSDGEALMYHIHYDKEFIDDVFYKYTKLETGSTSRHDIARIYKENGKYYFNLNLQIRMTGV